MSRQADGAAGLSGITQNLPPLALSVRQPWAWAIIHGGKDIENRTEGSIRAGNMVPGRIAIHAASGMKAEEYRWAVHKLLEVGVTCPRPDDLPRRAIIGSVTVLDIVSASESPWFGGPMGLRLANPQGCPAIPATGALGYFNWIAGGALAPVLPWMRDFDRANGDERTGELFPDLAPAFATPPARPYPDRRGARKPGSAAESPGEDENAQ
ncbi:MAG: hypothetical protein AAGK98_13665 [Pseudomonadota bacterium]